MRRLFLAVLMLTAAAAVAQQRPDVFGGTVIRTVADPGLPFGFAIIVYNLAAVDAVDVVTTVTLEGATWGRVDERCVPAGPVLRCALGTITASPTGMHAVMFEVEAIANDDPAMEAVRIVVSTSHQQGAPYETSASHRVYRTLYVTTDADSGPGSLRQAITDSVSHCADSAPCKVAFRIPGATAPWVTIRPETPLPPVHDIPLDARTQTKFFGDTNPDGPEIEINGALASRPMHGLRLDSAQLYAVTVNGFPGPGIRVDAGGLIEGSYIGVDPTGTRAVPNERGIEVNRADSSLHVSNSVISGNRRAGVFVFAAANAEVYDNRIGWNAKGTAGIPNGASGVFMGPMVSGAYVNENEIGHNAHAGIAVSNGEHIVEMRENAMHANGGLAIDCRLDGVTPETGAPFGKTFRAPRITAARYDAATDTTVIEGFQPGPRDGYATRSVTLYANDAPDESGYGEGQYVLADFAFATFDSPDNPAFSITLEGKPPGPWISATVTVGLHYYWLRTPGAHGNRQGLQTTTTEFSQTVPLAGY